MRYCFLLLSVLFFIVSCSPDKESSATDSLEPVKDRIAENVSGSINGTLRLKLKHVPDDTSDVYGVLNGASVLSVHPTFPDDPRFSERHHREGLDLWYDITFEKDIPLTKAADQVSANDLVQEVEFISGVTPTALPFNDPYLANQWHYHNDGSLAGSIQGCDINLFDAWTIATGSPDVIVAVMDCGVMYEHEDLAPNMWVNEPEFNGQKGVDDDGNGYVDDIYGYDFVAAASGMKGVIIPGEHGTHVSGTIAAVNDNSKGVCGIAGGTSSKPGTSIMCCQIMDDSQSGSYIGAAYVYAADNGAVISQNSWSIENASSLPSSIKEGIDYFIKYAGYDDSSLEKQSGPMMGGLVVFSAGNGSTNHCIPAEYPAVMAVAATAADYTNAYYSNYGDWVDICAPGGDAYKGHGIWSTLPDNNYAGTDWQGTSMAAPHVSGVAALVVDRFGGKGFTNEMLWDVLVNNANDEIYNHTPSLKGKFGAGMVDALKCLQSYGPLPPEKVTDISSSAFSNTITLQWKVPEDPDSQKASYFDVYYADRDISDLDIGHVPEDVTVVRVYGAGKSVGDVIAYDIVDLSFDTDYFFRIDALDAGGFNAGLSDQVIQKTGVNNPPVIEALDGNSISLKPHQTGTLRYRVYDSDGHDFSCKLHGGSAVRMSIDEDIVTLTFTGIAQDSGEYEAVLTATDKYQASTSSSVMYVILPNTPPEVIKTPGNIVFGQTGKDFTMKLSEFIIDPDGETTTLTYSTRAESSGKLVVDSSVDGDILTIRSKSYGYADVTVTCSDVMKATCSMSFRVLVRDASSPFDLYPNPVSNYLYLRSSEAETMNVTVYSSAGAKVFSGDVSADPFSPGMVDMSAMSGGVYSIIVERNGEKLSRTIVKL